MQEYTYKMNVFEGEAKKRPKSEKRDKSAYMPRVSWPFGGGGRVKP